ncbi:unnamed protein product, partial [Dracunculus medinensis]|uniref:Hypoxanthine phosphoribosyltransferase n=1 Tax=Dracunculus medinensis TaxID=318479 RepID=A0A0N4U623_DRAME
IFYIIPFELDSFQIPNCYYDDLSSVIIPEGFIKDRVKRLSQEIFAETGDQPLVMLCILKGSFRFFTTLVGELTIARASCSESLTVDFIRIRSYVNTEQSAGIEILGLSSLDELKGKNILIVEDIIDSGRTISKLVSTLNDIGVKKIWTAVLLSKRVTRLEKVMEDFVAFDIPNKFVVGYGLDYNQKFRDLNHICLVNQKGIEKYML